MAIEPSNVDYSSFFYCKYRFNKPVRKKDRGNSDVIYNKFSDVDGASKISYAINVNDDFKDLHGTKSESFPIYTDEKIADSYAKFNYNESKQKNWINNNVNTNQMLTNNSAMNVSAIRSEKINNSNVQFDNLRVRSKKTRKNRKNESKNFSHNQYRNANQKNTKREKGSFGFIFVVVICLIVAVYLATYQQTADNLNVPTFLSNREKGTYYAVEVNSFPDYDSAVVYGNQLRKQGGGGFLYLDGKEYKVLGAMYSTKKDAEEVVELLEKNISTARICMIRINDFSFDGYADGARELLQDTMEYAALTYSILYTISNDLDNEIVDDEAARVEIGKLITDLEQIKHDLETSSLISMGDFNVSKIKAQLTVTIDIIESLTNTEIVRPNLLCDVRYTYMLIIANHKNLVNSLQAE